MLILVKVAPPPPPPAEEDEESSSNEDGASKSEIKTGFHGTAAALEAQRKASAPSSNGGMLSLGTCRQIIEALSRFNVSPDGSGPDLLGETPGMATLYGPGCIVEIPTGGEPDSKQELSQAMITVTDDDFAWPVLSRICKTNSWKMMDPESGRMFG